ncbi:MAG: hypothetical protein Q8N45_12690, partial [Anaerolineales bacterium]|nr:hypothetical protein [Anaerolineales bacterium]
MRADETIRAEFEALLSPAIYAQAAYYRSLGLRERILNLPLMIAAILALLWWTIPFEHAGTRFTDRALVVWSEGKQRLDKRKRKTYLNRLLNGLEHIQKRLNNRRYKQRSYVEQRLTKLREGNPTWELVETHLDGSDGELQFGFRIDRQKLAEAQALDGR